MEADIQHFHDAPTGSFSYVVSDPGTGRAAIVDPVLGFSSVSGRTDPGLADAIIDYVSARLLKVDWILDTHAHADHLTAAQYLKQRLGGRVAIGRGICSVQAHFVDVFNLRPPFTANGQQFDHLFDDGDEFAIGSLAASVIHTPGHTNDSVTYAVGGALFVGDTLFAPDLGTARCDFPGGDAGVLYDSIKRLYTWPAETRVFLCHDYPPDDREALFCTTIGEERENNIHMASKTTRDEFVELRESRDAGLDLPRLILPAIQVNIRAGHLPPAEDNGVAYIRIPVDRI